MRKQKLDFGQTSWTPMSAAGVPPMGNNSNNKNEEMKKGKIEIKLPQRSKTKKDAKQSAE